MNLILSQMVRYYGWYSNKSRGMRLKQGLEKLLECEDDSPFVKHLRDDNELILRHFGGWAEVLGMRRRKERQITDERILGSGEFVERILNEAGEDGKVVLSTKQRQRKIKETIETECLRKGIHPKELKAGGRRAVVAQTRATIARKLVGEYGMSLAEVARNVGVSTTAISKTMIEGRKLN